MRRENTHLKRSEVERMFQSKGISDSHIQLMKKLKNRTDDIHHWYYDEGEEVENQMVEVAKIKGLGARGTVGRSWFKHTYKVKPRGNSLGMDLSRCKNAMDILERQSLDEFHSFFHYFPVTLTYYKEEDSYYVNDDGTHRTLFAKLTDCKIIKAHVMHMNLNHEKYNAFIRYKRTFIGYLNVMMVTKLGKFRKPPW